MFLNKVFFVFIVAFTVMVLVDSLETRRKHGYRGHKHHSRHHHYPSQRHYIDDDYYPHSHHHHHYHNHRTTRKSHNVGFNTVHRSRSFGEGFASSSSPKGDTYGISSTRSSVSGSRSRPMEADSLDPHLKKTFSRRDDPYISQKRTSHGKEVQRKLHTRRNKW